MSTIAIVCLIFLCIGAIGMIICGTAQICIPPLRAPMRILGIISSVLVVVATLLAMFIKFAA